MAKEVPKPRSRFDPIVLGFAHVPRNRRPRGSPDPGSGQIATRHMATESAGTDFKACHSKETKSTGLRTRHYGVRA